MVDEWEDHAVPMPVVEPAGGDEEDPGARAVRAWGEGWGTAWARPSERSQGLPSILKLGDIAAGPYRKAAGILAGAGGVGKTWAALDLAVKVAAGPDAGAHTWCGFDVIDEGRVVYVSAEDPAEILSDRLWVLTDRLTDRQRAKVAERLHVVSLNDASPELLRVWRISRQMEEGEAREVGVRTTSIVGEDGAVVSLRSPGVSEVKTLPSSLLLAMRADLGRARETGQGVCLVIMDPLSRLGGSDAETDNAVAARLMRELNGLADTAGAAVLMVHHTTKAARAGGITDGTGVRGSSALVDNARWVVELTLPDAGGVRLAVTKTSYGRGVPPVHLRREEWGGLRPETPTESAARLQAEEKTKKRSETKTKRSETNPSDKAPDDKPRRRRNEL